MWDLACKALNACRYDRRWGDRSWAFRGKKREKYGVIFSLFLAPCLIFTGHQTAYANVPNTYWDGNGENDFYVEMENISFPNYAAGTTVEVPYATLGRTSYALSYNNQTGLSAPFIYLAGSTDLPPSFGSFFRKLNDDIDIRILIASIESPVAESVPFPMTYIAGYISSELTKGIGYRSDFNAGMTGKVILRLRRDIIGGAVILQRDVAVASIFRSMSINSNSTTVPQNPIPAFRIILKGQTLPVPVQCSIKTHNQNSYDIIFGDLNSADITADGSRYGQELQLDYSCNNNSFNLPVKIDMIAGNSSFSSDYIATSNPNLGVVMRYGGKTVKPWGSFNSTLVNGSGSSVIYVAPVKNPAANRIATGDFTANAVLVMSVQ